MQNLCKRAFESINSSQAGFLYNVLIPFPIASLLKKRYTSANQEKNIRRKFQYRRSLFHGWIPVSDLTYYGGPKSQDRKRSKLRENSTISGKTASFFPFHHQQKACFLLMMERLLSAGTPELVFDTQELDGDACDCRTESTLVALFERQSPYDNL